MYWAQNAIDYCNCLINEFNLSDTKIFNSTNLRSLISNDIKSYLGNIGSQEKIIIKTSATGKRKKNHEISDEILETVCYATRQNAPNAKILLGEGMAYEPSFSKECHRLGWDIIARKYNIEILDLNYDKYIIMDNYWPVSKSWMTSNKVINVCKAKTHKRCGVTLSSKNLLGLLPGSVLGFPKLSYKHEYIPKLIYNIVKNSPQMLCIIDGINGIEGNGPMKGKPCKSNFVVTGTNPLNCDAIAAIQMGFHPAVVPGTIRPFDENYEIKEYNKDIINFKIDKFDFLPSLSCYWLYKSLYKDNEFINNSYVSLLKEIRICWEKQI